MHAAKMDLGEMGWGGINWIGLAQDRDEWMAHKMDLEETGWMVWTGLIWLLVVRLVGQLIRQ
jgi:hypothetical protein